MGNIVGNQPEGCAMFLFGPIYIFYGLCGWIFLIVKLSKNSTERSEIIRQCGLSESTDFDIAIAKQKEKINQLEKEHQEMKAYVDSSK